MSNKYWHAARQAQRLFTTDLSGTAMGQTRPESFGAQFREPIFAVTPSRDLIRLHGFVRRLFVASVPWRNIYWPSNKGYRLTQIMRGLGAFLQVPIYCSLFVS